MFNLRKRLRSRSHDKSAPRTVYAAGIDADGCYYNPRVVKGELELLGQPLIGHLTRQIFDADETTLFIDSNRQCFKDELRNAGNREYVSSSPTANAMGRRFYLDMEALEAHLQAIPELAGRSIVFDKLLLADVQHGRPAGYNFELAKKRYAAWQRAGVTALPVYSADNSDLRLAPHDEWDSDKTKFSIVYVQTHRIAAANPNATITFDFFDDLDKEILEPLRDLFAANPQFLPANLTLRMWHYNDDQPNLFAEIQGTGPIDRFYRDTINAIAAQLDAIKVRGSNGVLTGEYKIGGELIPDDVWPKFIDGLSGGNKMHGWVQEKIISPPDYTYLASALARADDYKAQAFVNMVTLSAFYHQSPLTVDEQQQIRTIAERLADIHKKAQSLNGRGFSNEAEAAKNLIISIQSQCLTHFAKSQADRAATVDNFKTVCFNEIETTKPSLSEHRGWKPLIHGLIQAITVVGLVVGLGRKAWGKPFNMFQGPPDSVRVLTDAEATFGSAPGSSQ